MNVPGALAAAAAAVLYGSAYVATAVALEAYSPAGIGVWRGVIGLVVLAAILGMPFMRDQRPPRLTRSALLRLVALGAIGGAVFILAVNAAVALSGATVTAFVAGLYAVLAAIIAVPVLGERLEARTLVALGTALGGTVLLADLGGTGASPGGIALALVAATAFGVFLVLSRRWGAPHRLTGSTVALASLSISATASAVVAAADGSLLPQAWATAPTLALAWIAVGPGAAASVLVVIGMRRLQARFASLFLLLNPPTAAALGAVLLNEQLSTAQLAGAALVLAAIAAASGALPTRTAFRRSSRPGSAPPTRS
jgi:drug/metabolite transporter (DMT)-like permease